jgi:Flp pilus assembly protein TadG
MTYLQLLHRIVNGTRLRKDSGQALVETAVSISFLLFILLGAAELGRVAYASIEVSNAARAATQYACMNGGAFIVNTSNQMSPDTAGMLNAAKADAYQISVLSPSSLTLTATMTAVCSDGTSAGNPPIAGGCGKKFMFMTVTTNTQAIFNPLIHVPGLGLTYTLHGQSIQQVLP